MPKKGSGGQQLAIAEVIQPAREKQTVEAPLTGQVW
jgi:hypothetical protein